jgi:hypothetical protein
MPAILLVQKRVVPPGANGSLFGEAPPAGTAPPAHDEPRHAHAQRDERAEIIAHMRRLATTGTGTTAVQAARFLDEVARQEAQWANDQGLLALLSPDQRKCIEHALKYEPVSQALAFKAWVGKPLQMRTFRRLAWHAGPVGHLACRAALRRQRGRSAGVAGDVRRVPPPRARSSVRFGRRSSETRR